MLIIINIIAHFLPLERASISSDDYVLLAKSKSIKTLHIPLQTLKVADRPLMFAFYMFQGKLVGHNTNLAFILLVLSNSLVLLAIFYLFIQLFNDTFTSFIASIIFSLLPNKLDLYQYLFNLSINIAMIAYIMSLVAFIFFIKKQKYIYLILSLCGYCVGIYWYAIGFFIPLVFVAFSYLYKKELTKYSLYFVIPAATYVIYLLTGVFGLGDLPMAGYKVDFFGIPKLALVDLFHHYFGRYMARNIIYGFYKFISIEQSWLFVIIFLNVLILLIVFLLLKRNSLSKTDIRLWIFGAVLFFVSLLPFFLSKERGFASRYLLMPSLGVSIIIICFLQILSKKWRIILFSFIFTSLIVCQGNAWSQVVACRIHAALFQTMNELKDELSKADNVIVDVRSMADKIPYTLVPREDNVLYSYYGAPVFHSEGLKSMIELVVGKNNKILYLAIESPRLTEEKLIEFSIISEKIAYRQVRKKTLFLPKENTIIIDFDDIYGEKFNNGIKKKKATND